MLFQTQLRLSESERFTAALSLSCPSGTQLCPSGTTRSFGATLSVMLGLLVVPRRAVILLPFVTRQQFLLCITELLYAGKWLLVTTALRVLFSAIFGLFPR